MMNKMNQILSSKFMIVAICCLVISWFVMAANAEVKQSKNSQKKQPTVSKSVSTAVKLDAKRSVKETKSIFYPELTKSELKIQEALNADTECDFSDTPLSEVMTLLADRHGITILFMENHLGAEGISVDVPVSFSVKGIALKNVLDLILEPIGLTFLVDREVVKITSIIEASEIYQTRVYPVRDFGNTPEVYLELESMIKNASRGYWHEGIFYCPSQTSVKGGLWNKSLIMQVSVDNEERGSFCVVRSSESLVISQTYQVHNVIVELLTQLRQARADQ